MKPLRSVAMVLLISTTVPVAAVLTMTFPLAQAQTAPTSGSSPGTSPLPTREVVVLGDSTALNLSYALAATAPPGFRVIGSTTFGCGLAVGTEISALPPEPGLPSAPACNETTPPAFRWSASDTQSVAGTGPRDIVLFLAGHDDTTGILQDGRWSDIRSPSFQRTELASIRELVAIATAHGAHLELLTMPCMDEAYSYHRKPRPDDSPQRRSIFNHLLREAAEDSSDKVSVVNFGAMLCPGGRFTLSIDGVQVRARDGVHIPSYAAGNPFASDAPPVVAERFYAWLGPRLWPEIIWADEHPGSRPPMNAG